MSLCRNFCATSRASSLTSLPRPSVSPTLVRHRSGTANAKRVAGIQKQKFYPRDYSSPDNHRDRKQHAGTDPRLLRPPRALTPESPASDIVQFFEANVNKWATRRRVRQRLARFAVSSDYITPLLNAFCRDVTLGLVRYTGGDNTTPFRKMTPQEKEELDARGQDALGYSLPRFARANVDDDIDAYMDLTFTVSLYAWAGTSRAKRYSKGPSPIPLSVFNQMASLAKATSYAEPTSPTYAFTRSVRRRFIMHVGPTNSGKTHNALRALAAAKTGLYAGPLRLLAHEIWERLNLGRIIPKGVNEDELRKEDLDAGEDTGLDVGDTKALLKQGLGKYRWRRECNLVTGEEHKIVSASAPFVSCTVEMINSTALYDVAVVDEIQLISDPQRGLGWTHAVLSLNAYEIHLCGEATAVPVIKALLESTGDTLEIHEYHRLSPLEVEEKSLEKNLENVRNGDCVVAFSRSSIFGLKMKLEKLGHRVACIYGKLPPEVRSEQAALFNNGECDVLVGSDALGLGLNLKIRRMIFSQTYKMTRDGKRMPLSVSQVKQIAGRAGRYGLHAPVRRPDGDASTNDTGTASPPPGLVTSFLPGELGFLRHTLSVTPPNIATAIIAPTASTLMSASELIKPSHAKLGEGQRCQSYLVTLADAHRYTAQTIPWLRYSGFDSQEHSWEKTAIWLEEQEASITSNTSGLGQPGAFDFDTIFMFFTAPLPLRDRGALAFCNALYRIYKEDLHVPLQRLLLEGLPEFEGGFVALLERTELSLGLAQPVEVPSTDGKKIPSPPHGKEDTPLPSFSIILQQMETLHSALGLYVWLTYRRPTSFSGMTEAQQLMPRVQKVIESVLSQRAAVANQLDFRAMEPMLQRGAPVDIEFTRENKTRRIIQQQRSDLFKGLQDAKRINGH